MFNIYFGLNWVPFTYLMRPVEGEITSGLGFDMKEHKGHFGLKPPGDIIYPFERHFFGPGVGGQLSLAVSHNINEALKIWMTFFAGGAGVGPMDVPMGEVWNFHGGCAILLDLRRSGWFFGLGAEVDCHKIRYGMVKAPINSYSDKRPKEAIFYTMILDPNHKPYDQTKHPFHYYKFYPYVTFGKHFASKNARVLWRAEMQVLLSPKTSVENVNFLVLRKDNMEAFQKLNPLVNSRSTPLRAAVACRNPVAMNFGWHMQLRVILGMEFILKGEL